MQEIIKNFRWIIGGYMLLGSFLYLVVGINETYTIFILIAFMFAIWFQLKIVK
jgi:hypothetical protein